jgi:hypothetical protein
VKQGATQLVDGVWTPTLPLFLPCPACTTLDNAFTTDLLPDIMPYTTIGTCPVCNALFDNLDHDEPELPGMVEAMMFQPERRKHAKESPACTNHPDWSKGWNTKTEKQPDV